MRYCKKCLMPDTRPGSIFTEDGVCQACLNYEERSRVDWTKRMEELKQLCDKYRRHDGYYDCILPVSGGKDSHFLLHAIKKEMGMNPLLLTIGDPFTKTKAGLKNFRNLGEAFNCDHFLFYISPDFFRRVTRIAFEEWGEPLRFVEAAIHTVTLKTAVKLSVPLVVFGENSAYEYGNTARDTYSALEMILKIFRSIDADYWLKKGVSKKEINSIIPPTQEELDRARPEVLFMSYFTPWSSIEHLELARKYGFTDLSGEWKREGYIEDFEQIDSVAYLINLWLKYPKFGFQRTSDIVSRRVREGKIDLVEARRLIMENDHRLDGRVLKDFLDFTRYTEKEFWAIVEKFWNRDIFEKINGKWRLKKEIPECGRKEKAACQEIHIN